VLVGALFIVAIALSLIIPRVTAAVRIARDARRLSAAAMVAQLYSQDHGGTYPDTLAAGLKDEDSDPGFASCAASDGSTPDPRYPYVYLGGGLTAGAVVPATVVAYTPLAYFDRQGADVCFGNGHVDWVTAADLPAVLARGGPVTRPATRPATPHASSP
jgi:type II secretory pathway pseudopilin PulG